MDPELHPDLAPLAFLLGTWRGEGRGEYPTIDPFGYGDEIIFERGDEDSVLYQQSTWLTDGTPSHRERGFLRPGAGPAEVELCLAHPLGLTEIAHGHLDDRSLALSTLDGGGVLRTRTASPVTALTRRYRVDDDVLTYELEMATEGTPMSIHVRARLRRRT